MNRVIQIKKIVREKVTVGKVIQSLEYLISQLNDDSEIFTATALLLVREKRIQKDIQAGVADRTSTKVAIQQNAIVKSLLETVSQLQEQDLADVENDSINDRISNLQEKFPDESIAFEDLIQEYESFIIDESALRLNTGYHSIDSLLQGMSREALTLICSKDIRESRNFVLNLIIEISKYHLIPFFYITLQKPSLYIVDDIFSMKNGFSRHDLVRSEGKIRKELKEAISAFDPFDYMIFFHETANTIDRIRDVILGRSLKYEVGLIIIDNLAFIENSLSRDLILQELKRLCIDQKVRIILLSQEPLADDPEIAEPIVESKIDKSIYLDNVLVVENDMLTLGKPLVDALSQVDETIDGEHVYVSVLKSQYGSPNTGKLEFIEETGRIREVESINEGNGSAD